LGQGQAQVGPDLELHQHQSGKADDGGQAAGRDGGGRLGQRLHHAVAGVGPGAGGPHLGEPVDQKDRVVQRDGQLQDAAGGAGDKGDLPEDQVGAVVDEDGGPHPQHDQDRFGPAGGGQPQDEKDVEDGHGGDLGHFHHGGVGGRRGGHRRAGQCAGVPQQGVDGGHGLGPLVVGHRDGEQGRPVLIIGFDGGG